MTVRLGFFVVTIALLAPGMAAAQALRYAPAPPPTHSLPEQGMIQVSNQDQPVNIDAAFLNVRNKSKIATFSGNVRVVQGDTTLTCEKLVVFYGEEVSGAEQAGSEPQASKPADDATKSAQRIRRIEAIGRVTVVTRDQSGSGDFGVYDIDQKTIRLFGSPR